MMNKDMRFNLLYRLGVFYHQSHQYMKQYMAEAELLSMEQPLVLYMIMSSQPVLQKDLAKMMQVRPATISLHLKRLEAEGYIKRESGRNDKRQTFVSLTDKGQATLQKGYESALAFSHDMTSALSDEEVLLLRNLIDKMLQAIKESKEESHHV